MERSTQEFLDNILQCCREKQMILSQFFAALSDDSVADMARVLGVPVERLYTESFEENNN